MINMIRGWVYAAGYRPRRENLLFSQVEDSRRTYLSNLKKNTYPVVILDLGDRSAWQAVTEGIEQMKYEQAERQATGTPPTLYQSMNFCPMCGSVLVQLVLDVKRCPHSHGKAYTTDTAAGLAAIMFEPAGNDE